MGSEYPVFCGFPRIHMTHSTFFIDDICMSRNGVISQRARILEQISESKPQRRAVQPVIDFSQSSPHQQSNLMLLRRQFPVLRSLARCVDMNWLAVLVCFLYYCY